MFILCIIFSELHWLSTTQMSPTTFFLMSVVSLFPIPLLRCSTIHTLLHLQRSYAECLIVTTALFLGGSCKHPTYCVSTHSGLPAWAQGLKPDYTVSSGLLPEREGYPQGLVSWSNRTAVPIYCGYNFASKQECQFWLYPNMIYLGNVKIDTFVHLVFCDLRSDQHASSGC